MLARRPSGHNPVSRNRSRLLPGIACILGLLPATVPAIRVARQSGSLKITQIRVTGNHHFTEAQIVAASGLKVGDPAIEDSLNDAASRLAQTGAFSDVTYQYRAKAASWEAEFQVTEAIAFLPCTFDNFIWFSDADLVAAARGDVPLFDGSLPAGAGSLKDDVAASLNRYLLAHQIKGSTTITPASDNLGGKLTTFIVRISDLPMPVLRVEVAGGPLDAATMSNAASGLIGNSYSRRASVLVARTALTETYQEAAYLQPRFSDPTPAIAGPGSKDVSDGVVVKFVVTPGLKYSWAGVAWTGNQALSAAQLTSVLPVSPGEPARRSKLLAGWEAANSAFQSRGYLSVQIAPSPRYDDNASTVRFDVQVAEGPQFVMGDLTVDDPSEKVGQDLAAAWPLKKGQVFDMTAEKEFLRTGVSRVLAHDGAPRKSVSVALDLHPDMRVANVLLRTVK